VFCVVFVFMMCSVCCTIDGVFCVFIVQLEEEREEVERQLQHEHNARRLQEQINQEQSRLAHQHDLMTSTARKVSRSRLHFLLLVASN
jgi:hypothetical protein